MNAKVKQTIFYAVMTAILVLATEMLFYLHALVDFSANTPHMPNTRRGRKPNPRHVPGVSGPSIYTVNSLGLRGPEPTQGDIFCIVFGNSTAECAWLDDSESWPRLTMKRVNDSREGRRVVFNNASNGGLLCQHNVYQLKALVKTRERIDFALLLPGVPELHKWLRSKTYRKITKMEEIEAFANGTFLWWPYPRGRRETVINQYANRARERIGHGLRRTFGLTIQTDRDGSSMVEARKRYRQAVKLDRLPANRERQLQRALAHLRHNLREFVEICQKHSIGVVLLTPPIMYRPQMPEKYIDYYMSAVRNPKMPLLTPRLYHEVLGRFAALIRGTAREFRVPCVDFYRLLSPEVDGFYDQVHVNEHGAEKAAQILGNYLLDHEIFDF